MAKQTFTTGQVLTAAQMTSLQQTAMLGGAANAKVASYVLVAADAGDAITMSNASATTITVNTGLFAAGDIVTIINLGAGVCTITAGTATVTTSGSLALAQNQGGVLRFTSASAAIFFQFATPASGDIEGVTAGTGISGGGTSGTVTITNSMATEITAKGDLIVGTGNAAFDNLPVGTNGHILVADSSVSPTGLKWAAPSSGAAVLVKRVAFSGVANTGTDFDGVFTSTYGTYIISFEEALAGVSPFTQDAELIMRNAGADVTASNYYSSNGRVTQSAVTTTFYGTSPDTKFTVSENAYIYGTLQYNKAANFFSGFLYDEISGNYYEIRMTLTESTKDGFKLQMSSGNISGTVAVYGLAKS